MQKKDIIALASKISEGTASKEEMLLYVSLLNEFSRRYPDWQEVDEEIKNKIGLEMSDFIKKRIVASEPHRQVKVLLWRKFIAFAAAIAIILTGLWFFLYDIHEAKPIDKITYANDLPPGKNGATLILANGEKISLTSNTEGVVVSNGGIRVTGTSGGNLLYRVPGTSLNKQGKDVSMNTLSTGNGQTYVIELPDHSKVWLNASSSLTFPSSFSTDKKNGSQLRQVLLEGEGYFEITKDNAHPFVVNTSRQQVEVIGTHFNISSYSNEMESQTTLLTGSVKVKTLKYPIDQRILLPGQQAKVSGNLKVVQADIPYVMAWKNGLFIFKDQPLEAIMRQVERWYDVEVVYQDDVRGKTFWGRMDRFRNVSEVLQILELTKKVHFKIEGRRITVMK